MGDAEQFTAAVPERSGPEGTGATDLSGAPQGGAATVSEVKLCRWIRQS